MGRGDNRCSLKMRQRKQWRAKKTRLKNRITDGKANAGAKKVERASTPATLDTAAPTILRQTEEAVAETTTEATVPEQTNTPSEG
jgi:hypothetical protein